MIESVAILCGGGPAPGINTVISSVTKIFINNGYNVLGINGGYKSLFSNEPAFEFLDFDYADQIYSRGGSALKMSRYKPKDDEFNIDFFKKNNVKLLVTIGIDVLDRTIRIERHNDQVLAVITFPITLQDAVVDLAGLIGHAKLVSGMKVRHSEQLCDRREVPISIVPHCQCCLIDNYRQYPRSGIRTDNYQKRDVSSLECLEFFPPAF